jgi:Flp pilus assembly protein TadG
MILSRLKLRLRQDCGSSLVEFSIVCFLLIMVLMGIVEFSRMVLVYNDLSDAASAGVRYAAVHGETQTSVTNVQALVRNYLSSAPLIAANATVDVCYGSAATTCTSQSCGSRTSTAGYSTNAPIAAYVTVCVKYAYDPLTTYFPLSVTLGGQGEGVVLY